jgi:hypothetical protein
MAQHKLVIVKNDLPDSLQFENKECAADNLTIAANSTANTPGQNGEGCDVPDCSEAKYWDAHRMTFTTGSTVYNLWKVKNQIFASMGSSYPNPVPTGIDMSDNVQIEISPGGTAAANTTTGEKDHKALKVVKIVAKMGAKAVALL